MGYLLEPCLHLVANHLRVFLNLLSVYYLNFQNTQGDKMDLAWAQADAVFIQCVVNAANRKAAPTFSSEIDSGRKEGRREG